MLHCIPVTLYSVYLTGSRIRVLPSTEDRAADLRIMVGLLTEDDMKAMLAVSDHTLQAWRMQGNGPKFVKLGKAVFYRICDVSEWINSNVKEKTTEAA